MSIKNLTAAAVAMACLMSISAGLTAFAAHAQVAAVGLPGPTVA